MSLQYISTGKQMVYEMLNLQGSFAHPEMDSKALNGTQPAFWMEFLEGPSFLHELLNSRPKRRLGVHDALRLSIHIGAALGHVHERGLLHLDVKPSNIIVVKGRPVLCDFGIARWQRAKRRPNRPIGTEGFMAPEEWLLEKMTPAADIFGLGVTLYELLTGKLPFPEKVSGQKPIRRPGRRQHPFGSIGPPCQSSSRGKHSWLPQPCPEGAPSS